MQANETIGDLSFRVTNSKMMLLGGMQGHREVKETVADFPPTLDGFLAAIELTRGSAGRGAVYACRAGKVIDVDDASTVPDWRGMRRPGPLLVNSGDLRRLDAMLDAPPSESEQFARMMEWIERVA